MSKKIMGSHDVNITTSHLGGESANLLTATNN